MTQQQWEEARRSETYWDARQVGSQGTQVGPVAVGGGKAQRDVLGRTTSEFEGQLYRAGRGCGCSAAAVGGSKAQRDVLVCATGGFEES